MILDRLLVFYRFIDIFRETIIINHNVELKPFGTQNFPFVGHSNIH